MFFLCKVVDVRGLILVVDAPFPTIPLDVCEFVDREGVSFVNGCAMKLFGGCYSLLWRLIFDESVAVEVRPGSL